MNSRNKASFSQCRNRKDKVALVCGGGSGHEPFAAGFVGGGMLTASIAGSIFAAPPSIHITYALQCVAKNNKAGVLVVVPNYTGDCLNFGIAIEKARQTGIKVEEIIIGDDCSISESEQGVAGKRGLVGMLFAIKIAGALAEKGSPLHEVVEIAQHVSQNTATYGVGLSACAIPGQGLMFELAQDEVECGMGVHGEAGYERIKLKTASELVSLMLERICKTLVLVANDSVAVIVNNFGGLSQLEQGIVVREVVYQLQNMNIHAVRIYSGVLMTSLNSAGVHISLLKLTESHKDVLIKYLDEETTAPCWPGRSYSIPSTATRIPSKDTEKRIAEKTGISLNIQEQYLTKLCLKSVCAAIIEKEAYLNELGNDAIQPTIQLLVTLRFYATGSFFRTIGDFCGISVSSAQRIVQKVSPSIAALREEFIKLPTSHEEIYQNMENFYRIAKFVRVIGCIDCTHISVLSYGGNESELFRNRKGYFSINVQVVCNAQLQIIDIVARWPGSAHDSTIFNNSRIKALFEANVFGNGVLLGDSGYPNISYMMCPLQNPTTPAEQLYNESQIRTRATVERCFGIWKKRFPVLSVGMRLRKIETTLSIIVATAVLHNMINQYFEDDLINRQIYDDASALMQNIEERNRNDQNVTNMRHTMVEYFQRLI